MLKKLLRYDFAFLFRYWWIGAFISLLVSLVGGGCIYVLNSKADLPDVVDVGAGLMLVLSVFCLVAFAILSMIIVFIRYYKNFFSDEGYLTFTLPVKTSTLLASKLISGVSAILATAFVIGAEVFIMLAAGFGDEFTGILEELWKLIANEVGAISILYAVELLMILVVYSAFSVLFAYVCITLASVITRKARVITAIGLYYGANSVLNFGRQMFLIFGTQSLFSRMDGLSGDEIKAVFALVFLAAFLFIALLCGFMYVLQRYMLDKKLNLA